ncbi:MAG: hypothetical protein KGR68_15195 [Betaproteobacteria bacterium]|nr:hypothetical protein [Betaproteobacteria bacterium]
MSAKHTPGPWVLENRGYKFIVSKPGDGYITRDVCRMDASTMSAFAQEANARLIAAAPELLEALRVFVSAAYPVTTEINPRGHAWSEAYLDQALDNARAAIAKAEGKP